MLYAVTSAANNNGSAFGGLSAGTTFWNLLLAFCMLVGRFGVIVPVMAIAGSLVNKKIQPASSGTLATHDALFIGSAYRHRPAGRRPDLYPRTGARPGGGTLLFTLSDAEQPVMSRKQLALLEPTLVRQALLDAVKKTQPLGAVA